MQKAIIQFIPNGLTLANLMAGAAGILLIIQDMPHWAFLCLLIGLLADFFDGFAAKTLKVSSPLGVQLDSLADLITFGLMPVVLYFYLAAEAGASSTLAGVAVLFFASCAAFRLGRFNVADHPGPDFSGLPTPASGLTAMAICWNISRPDSIQWLEIQPGAVTSVVVLVLGLLMVSNIRFLSLKFTNYRFRENILKYAILGGSLILIIALWLDAVLPVVIWYFLLSAASNFIPSTKPEQAKE